MGTTVNSSSGNTHVQNDIDASSTANWGAELVFPHWDTSKWGIPGHLNGNGKVIRNLFINRPDQFNVGLFGLIDSCGVVKNIGLSGGSVTGSNYVGSLAGCNGGSVLSSYATVQVMGKKLYRRPHGGNEGLAVNSYAMGRVIGDGWIGGLAGYNDGVMSKCFATGMVTGKNDTVGGLIGINYDA